MKGMFLWADPRKGRSLGGIDVSSNGPENFRILSPFSYDASYKIPLPGNEDLRADSVEGIWQGLKIINGRNDLSLLKGKPRKRRGETRGHCFGEKTLDYLSARVQIYAPSYIYHAVNNCLDNTAGDLERRLERDKLVFLYDIEYNENINDLSRPYSHAALLVELLNMMKDAPLPPFHKPKFTYLREQIDATLRYRDGLSRKNQKLLDDIITFAYLFSGDELKEDFALQAIHKGKIRHNQRLNRFKPSTQTTREDFTRLFSSG